MRRPSNTTYSLVTFLRTFGEVCDIGASLRLLYHILGSGENIVVTLSCGKLFTISIVACNNMYPFNKDEQHQLVLFSTLKTYQVRVGGDGRRRRHFTLTKISTLKLIIWQRIPELKTHTHNNFERPIQKKNTPWDRK